MRAVSIILRKSSTLRPLAPPGLSEGDGREDEDEQDQDDQQDNDGGDDNDPSGDTQQDDEHEKQAIICKSGYG